jgi:hypothetical protein
MVKFSDEPITDGRETLLAMAGRWGGGPTSVGEATDGALGSAAMDGGATPLGRPRRSSAGRKVRLCAVSPAWGSVEDGARPCRAPASPTLPQQGGGPTRWRQITSGWRLYPAGLQWRCEALHSGGAWGEKGRKHLEKGGEAGGGGCS